MGLILVFVSLFLKAFAEAASKIAAIQSISFSSLLFNYWYWLALGASVVQAVCWLFALRYIPVSVAYPVLSLSLLSAVIVGSSYFDEVISLSEVVGLGLVILGVYLILKKDYTTEVA